MVSEQVKSSVSTGKGGQSSAQPSEAQLNWLRMGLEQPGGKLPLFDRQGQRIDKRTVRACLANGWAEPWVPNPIKPDWEVCKLSEAGRKLLGKGN
ncbi:MAG: hypothetical protein KDJ62_00610 [Rhodobiaceae bacterium]|nr:hypothetical protein [Rhodobiaceae bacterium]MCC0050002.1 hypothetical protein [Rhodobiaceae bacterium]